MILHSPLVEHPQLWHQLFEALAMVCGYQFYKKNARDVANNFPVVIGALLGAGIGNKLVFWLERVDLWNVLLTSPQTWFMGQSMVGGLVGGLIGVEVAKLLSGIKESTGDDFVYPLLLSICIGRVGCFIAGLSDGTFGNPSNLPWAVDFGDGVPRHPTQLYEIIFTILLWITLVKWESLLKVIPGLQFKLMLSSYLLWRLCIDSIKPVPFDWIGGLSGIQFICILALIIYMPFVFRDFFKCKLVVKNSQKM